MDFGVYYERWNSPALTLFILSTGWDNSGYGFLVRARDQYGYIHSFAHNSQFLVSPGQTIVMGQPHSVSGNSGFSTAAHGHWGVQLPGSTGYNNYINPRNWPGFNQQAPTMDERYAEDWARLAYLYYLGREPSQAERRSRINQPWDKALKDIAESAEAKAYAQNKSTIDKNKLIQFIKEN